MKKIIRIHLFVITNQIHHNKIANKAKTAAEIVNKYPEQVPRQLDTFANAF